MKDRIKNFVKNNKALSNFYFSKIVPNHNNRIKKRASKTKIGASYSVFDGTELLEASLKSIKNNVHYINIVYQDVSYTGEPIKKETIKFLESLVDKGLVDKLILYKNDSTLTPIQNEARKRNLGLQDCKKHRIKYFLSMDVDEFYEDKQFKDALITILEKNITSSACLMYYYVKKPIYRFSNVHHYYVPFLQKVNMFSRIVPQNNYFCVVDPTRTIKRHSPKKTFAFGKTFLVMHHFAWVRKDLKAKFINSSGNSNRPREFTKEQEDFYKEISNYKYPNVFHMPDGRIEPVIEVKDIFNIAESLNK